MIAWFPQEEDEAEGRTKKRLEDSILDRSCFLFGEANFIRRTARVSDFPLFSSTMLFLPQFYSIFTTLFTPILLPVELNFTPFLHRLPGRRWHIRVRDLCPPAHRGQQVCLQ